MSKTYGKWEHSQSLVKALATDKFNKVLEVAEVKTIYIQQWTYDGFFEFGWEAARGQRPVH